MDGFYNMFLLCMYRIDNRYIIYIYITIYIYNIVISICTQAEKTIRNDKNICMPCVFSTVNISGVGRDNVIHFFETSQIISSLTLSHLGPRVATHIAR